MTGRDDPSWGWEFVVEDFVYARLAEEDATASRLPDGTDRDAAVARVAALRELLAEHSIYVTPPDSPERASSREVEEQYGLRSMAGGVSAGRCYTCEAVCGVPCVTVTALARIWVGHPDFPAAHRDHRNRSNAEVVAAGTFRRLHWPETVA
ncbi:hypothetical protein GCM10011608_10770 [Micromonospora sonchi]|uniref:Uncharacterized protein n=1 Tax=Micromonospora sonchi TaxID=1763543 RepID=A0A917TLJ7_9ACTN|nr:hypothetical protein [Micromonospora sonchi]GGM27822.1 hypothetical protein GCM10011608_10770 [Micromonospora sonchi]